MLRKLFVTAAAAATVSVPLAGVARADKPDDPGSGNQGVPDRAAAVVEATVEAITGNGEHALDGFQSGKSGVTAPGTAFATGAKVEGLNTPDGYGVALNDYYIGRGVDPALVGGPFGRTIPGSVTKQLTHGCAQHSSESASANLGLQKGNSAARIPFLGAVRRHPLAVSIAEGAGVVAGRNIRGVVIHDH